MVWVKSTHFWWVNDKLHYRNLILVCNRFSQTLKPSHCLTQLTACSAGFYNQLKSMLASIPSCLKFLPSVNISFQFFATLTEPQNRSAFSRWNRDDEKLFNTCGKNWKLNCNSGFGCCRESQFYSTIQITMLLSEDYRIYLRWSSEETGGRYSKRCL